MRLTRPGEGFLAHELMQVMPAAVTGMPDAVNEDGSVQAAASRSLTHCPVAHGALQETLAQVQALTARVVSLEEQLGV